MTAHRHVWIASALSVALVANAGCNWSEPGEITAAQAPAEQRRPDRSDASITTSIQSQYFTDATIKGHDIDVVTDKGVVTLKGTVDTGAERTQAAQIATQVEGVTRVDDQLQVAVGAARGNDGKPANTPPESGTPAATRFTDLRAGWITTKIQAQYFADPDVKAWNIDVDTANSGTVTLRGTVDSPNTRQEAVRIAKATEGVRQVVDELRVRNASGSATDTAAARQPADDDPLGDPWITAIVQSKYFLDDEVKGAAIDVTTQSGIVTLKGEVSTPSERRQAVALARSTSGVREVRDQLSVASKAPTANAARPDAGDASAGRQDSDLTERMDDAWITTKIQSKYFMDQQVRSGDIDVTTKDGIVTLKGAVGSEETRRTAEQIARETRGVTSVVNQLTVKPETEPTA